MFYGIHQNLFFVLRARPSARVLMNENSIIYKNAWEFMDIGYWAAAHNNNHKYNNFI